MPERTPSATAVNTESQHLPAWLLVPGLFGA
jgi:hypothetical protein